MTDLVQPGDSTRYRLPLIVEQPTGIEEVSPAARDAFPRIKQNLETVAQHTLGVNPQVAAVTGRQIRPGDKRGDWSLATFALLFDNITVDEVTAYRDKLIGVLNGEGREALWGDENLAEPEVFFPTAEQLKTLRELAESERDAKNAGGASSDAAKRKQQERAQAKKWQGESRLDANAGAPAAAGKDRSAQYDDMSAEDLDAMF